MALTDGLDSLAQQTAALEQSLGGAQVMAAAFDAELGRMFLDVQGHELRAVFRLAPVPGVLERAP